MSDATSTAGQTHGKPTTDTNSQPSRWYSIGILGLITALVAIVTAAGS